MYHYARSGFLALILLLTIAAPTHAQWTPEGTVIASDKAMCDTCPRKDTRTSERMPAIVRPQTPDSHSASPASLTGSRYTTNMK